MLLPAGERRGGSGVWVAPPGIAQREEREDTDWGRVVPRCGVSVCPGVGSGIVLVWGQVTRRAERRKTGLNFETKLGGHPGERLSTWHGVMEAGGSPGAAPRYKMRHNEQ